MNTYLLALIALVAAFAVGFCIYGQLFKGPLGTAGEKLDTTHLAVASVTIYLSALAFIYLYDHITFGDYTGAAKGVTLGLLVGIGLFALPLFADSGFLKPDKDAQLAVTLNWILSFVVMGLVVGWLR